MLKLHSVLGKTTASTSKYCSIHSIQVTGAPDYSAQNGHGYSCPEVKVADVGGRLVSFLQYSSPTPITFQSRFSGSQPAMQYQRAARPDRRSVTVGLYRCNGPRAYSRDISYVTFLGRLFYRSYWVSICRRFGRR